MSNTIKLSQLKVGNNGAQELAAALHVEHRTSQALIVETLLKGIAIWAEESDQRGMTDIRNELAVRKARQHLQPVDIEDQARFESGDMSHLSMYQC